MAPEALSALQARILAIRAEAGGPPPIDVCTSARDVVLLGSSSRGGSSIFAEVLRKSAGMVHLRAEINPALRLHGIDPPESDALPRDTPIPAGLSQSIGVDCGNPTDRLDGAVAVRQFTAQIAERLSLQWPTEAFDVALLRADVDRVLAALQREDGWLEGEFRDPQPFHARLLARVRARHPAVHPGAYDIDRRLLAKTCPDAVDVPFSPRMLIEEPPFVLTTPWIPATAEALARRPLIIKTPSNAYRIPWLRRLFPNATVRVLHLTRNVAASVNGLYDGWRYPAFHSHASELPLSIAGYSETAPEGHRWWKFDRPPGWQSLRERRLEDVCAFQWRSAHGAILESGADRFRLAFEDVMANSARQAPALSALAHWLGVPVEPELTRILTGALPVVMATAQPRHRRWFARVDLLTPLLADPSLRELMERLGYDPDPSTYE